jgi:3-deoxy-D-manno-octulosonic acid kinase
MTTGRRGAEPNGAPHGYVDVRHGDARARVWSPGAEWALSVFASGATLHEWAAARSDRRDFPGRGEVHAVPAPAAGPDGVDRWAVRHYRRGGAMAMHMGDRYLRAGTPRPFRELDASLVARARGIRTPAVVAGATYHDGVYYRCDLVTEWVPDAPTLAEVLQREDGTRGWLVAMARAGELVRELSRAGIFHVDLNARNILLADDGTRWVIDLDRARVLRGPSQTAAERMSARLTRSIVKVGTPTGEHLSDREVQRALETRPEEL